MTDDLEALKARLAQAESDARDLSWIRAALEGGEHTDCARCGDELATDDGAVSVDQGQRTITRVCGPCVSTWAADNPGHYMIRACDLTKRGATTTH